MQYVPEQSCSHDVVRFPPRHSACVEACATGGVWQELIFKGVCMQVVVDLNGCALAKGHVTISC